MRASWLLFWLVVFATGFVVAAVTAFTLVTAAAAILLPVALLVWLLDRLLARPKVKHQVVEQRGSRAATPGAATAYASPRLNDVHGLTETIRVAGRRLPNAGARTYAEAVVERSERIMARLHARPDQLRSDGHSLVVILQSAVGVLAEYEAILKTGATADHPSLQRLDHTVLPKLEVALAGFYEKLLADDITSIEASMKTLEDTLALEGYGPELRPRQLPVAARVG